MSSNQTQPVRIELPFKRALNAAARQNYGRAVRLGRTVRGPWKAVGREFINEARALLLRDGENHLPMAPDVEHIVLASGRG